VSAKRERGALPLPGPHPTKGLRASGHHGLAPGAAAVGHAVLARRALLAAPALLLPAGPAAAVTLDEGGLAQGGFVIGRAAPGTRVALDGRALRVTSDGTFAFGFGRDHAPQATLAITHPDNRRETRRLAVAPRQWREQRINGLPPGQVTPDEATLQRILRERETLAAARATDSALTGFAQGFIAPTQGRISGVFGSRRILNGQPRQPHYGLDFAVPTGTPLKAIAAGRVTLAESFHFFGDLVVIDHGHGVNSLYAHLSAIEVRHGQMVAQGERIALSGATGRVTGPHLHFSFSWFQTFLDPQPVVMPA
jgi:murein DD-endopeptidase MepM/ murein hydrolase activator NlpD